MSEIIPEQQEGASSDTSSSYTAGSEQEAKEVFRTAAHRLLHVSNWRSYYSAPGAAFTLTDPTGAPVQRAAEQGDYFEIDLPAPGPSAGNGRDWVKIEAIESSGTEDGNSQSIAIRVRPASSPRNNEEDVAHFFNDTATSSFIVAREGTKVTASVHGRNEQPNTEAHSLGDKIRNTVTALGAMIGLSKTQWKKLTEGLLERNK